ncbi:MAG: hypothetical protein K2K31_01145 [Clostridia bacterium]|nr:hypothetical protein [Clostridia bacterium]
MAFPIYERYRTENKKFHYDIKSLKLHRKSDYVYYSCEIIADRDIVVDYTLGVVDYHNVIPKGARGGRVWVDGDLIKKYYREHKLDAQFDFQGGLSQGGNCWVGPDCVVGPGSYVNDNAIVINKSKLFYVHVGHRAVVDRSEIVCADPETLVVTRGDKHFNVLKGGTSTIMNDCKVSNSVVKQTYLNMEGCAKLSHTTVERKEFCKGGLSMKDNGVLNHCNIKITGNDNMVVSGNSVHSDKSIEGYGPSNGMNVNITRTIAD